MKLQREHMQAMTCTLTYHRVLSRQLQSINASHNLIHVASNRGWIVQGQFQLLVRANDENCPDSQRQVIAILVARVKHSISASSSGVTKSSKTSRIQSNTQAGTEKREEEEEL